MALWKRKKSKYRYLFICQSALKTKGVIGLDLTRGPRKCIPQNQPKDLKIEKEIHKVNNSILRLSNKLEDVSSRMKRMEDKQQVSHGRIWEGFS